jgi:hypothetical protein
MGFLAQTVNNLHLAKLLMKAEQCALQKQPLTAFRRACGVGHALWSQDDLGTAREACCRGQTIMPTREFRFESSQRTEKARELGRDLSDGDLVRYNPTADY